MDQVFNTTCIMIKWWRQTLSKSVMIAMAGAIPELVASRSSRRRRSLSQDQITKWNWDENPLFSRRKKRPVVEIDVPKFPKIFLVGVLPASLSHVVPGQDSISFPIFGILSSEIRKIINTAILDKPARLTIRVLWFLFLIVKSEVKKQIGRRWHCPWCSKSSHSFFVYFQQFWRHTNKNNIWRWSALNKIRCAVSR